jgi:sensor histidine kinase YesM
VTNQIFKKTVRWFIIISTLLIVSLILWNTYVFFQKFKAEERAKMEILALTYKRASEAPLNADLLLENKILESNTSIPMILTDNKGNILYHRNLNIRKTPDSLYLSRQLQKMKSQNNPIVIPYEKGLPQYIYYMDSSVLTKLKYYPLALIFVLFLFAMIIYLFNRSSRIASENYLWTGMAKETAHQMGTPLTSLLGWITILKEENPDIGKEIEKDVTRLQIIADRFSKIGSKGQLKSENIIAITRSVFDYMQQRSSDKINFDFITDRESITCNINKELYSWVIENLIKNAIDAMQGKGRLSLNITHKSQKILISISDTGKGIPKNRFKEVFAPGYTTKPRGWGLGLSLSKRIIEDYHKGKIYIKDSKPGTGTEFCIELTC